MNTKTRRNLRIATICVAAAMLAAVIPFTALFAQSAAANYSANNIGEAQAKSIALKHAGVTESQTTNLRVRLDIGRIRSEYEIDFYVGNVEYEYEIDAATGVIREYDRETKRAHGSGSGSGSGGSSSSNTAPRTTPNPANFIGDAQAKSIALARAGVAENQTASMRVRLDSGRYNADYDVDFYVGDTYYEFELDAATGQILEFDQEVRHNRGANGQTPQATPNPANFIGENQAKGIAFAHAGVTESQATYFRIILDQDRRGADYDIKFNVGDAGYEYEIAAETGEILEFDQTFKRAVTQSASTAPGSAAPTSSSGAANAPSSSAAQSTTYIGEDAAKSIALNAAGLAESQVQRMKVKLDREHKTMVYEIDFRNGYVEYEYDIDAVTGAIVKSDVEYDDD